MPHEDSVNERLARIEVSQTNQAQQLGKVLVLLDRMVRVEERQQSVTDDISSIKARLLVIEDELKSWSTARKVIAWIVGIIGTLIAGGILVMLRTISV